MNKSIFASDKKVSSKVCAKAVTADPEHTYQKVENNTIQAYNWRVETNMGCFTGTCLSMDDVNKEIVTLTNNARILKKNIVPTILTNENPEHKIYSWNVITNNSNATGISTSLKEAQRAVKSFGTTQVLKSNIVESLTTSK